MPKLRAVLQHKAAVEGMTNDLATVVRLFNGAKVCKLLPLERSTDCRCADVNERRD